MMEKPAEGLAEAGGQADLRNRAAILLTRGDLEGARSAVDSALEGAPEDADLLALRGACRARQGELSDGIQDLATAVMARPKDWELLNNLAVHLQQMKMFDEAVVFHVKAINNSEPDQHPQLYINLGLAMMGQGEHLGAIQLFETVLSVHPDMVDAAVNLSSALNSLKEYGRSVDVCRRTLAIAEAPELYHNLGNALHKIPGRDAEALAAFEKALALDPTNWKSKHMLSLLRDEDMDEIPANFVEGLFDEYASYYERDVIEKLRYRVPGLIRRYLLKAVPGRTRFDSVLDLGCGTGLTGVMLRDITDFQKGVDISRNMLKVALEKEIYDQIEAVDLQVGLGEIDRAYSVAVAADVCGYIGRLEPIFEKVAAVLEAGGLFAFSVEESFLADFEVSAAGRFAHRRTYVQKALADAGFKVLSVAREQLRNSGGRPVFGMIFIAQKPT
ncbi:hypothetical protein N825_34330 [Skermanella stibiiresistens SB22]|uniref:Methyltransferase type 12 domain-containing protein n=2 Tax=Skermanella TaxID=204447 RepID=W9GPI3_9PROT|nr:hypothetical protein N825_34330 [Skermanella stibiiresistens SB22]